jgi:DNA-binding HxlR family transcriptional regulator
MQRTSLGDMACSLARSLDVAGEWWTPMIVRDVWLGHRRFDQIQHNLDISRKVLAERLDHLVIEGVLERRPYQERPQRHEYWLTEKGKELMDALLTLMAWGDRWTAGEAGPPIVLRHKHCGKEAEAQVTCSSCGEPLHAFEVRAEAGPGARVGRGARGADRLPGYDRARTG